MAKTNRKKPLNHHIVYNEREGQEVVVPIYPIEHYICMLLQRRGSLISKGFIKHLRFFIWKHEDGAIDLTDEAVKYDTKSADASAPTKTTKEK